VGKPEAHLTWAPLSFIRYAAPRSCQPVTSLHRTPSVPVSYSILQNHGHLSDLLAPTEASLRPPIEPTADELQRVFRPLLGSFLADGVDCTSVPKFVG